MTDPIQRILLVAVPMLALAPLPAQSEGETDRVEVDGVLVPAEAAEDARRGYFRHGGRVVTKAEMEAFLAGQVRHPVTGQPIPAEDLAKADAGQFFENGRWLGKDEAQRLHASIDNPWVLRTERGYLITNIDVDDFAARKNDIDTAVATASRIFGGELPSAHLPAVMVVESAEEHRRLGDQAGGAGSAYGAFLASVRDGRIGVAHDHESWGPFWTRHAAGLSTAAGWAEYREVELPEWFMRAVGSLVSRHQDDYYSAQFGKQHLAKGGVPSLRDWFSSFQISAESPNDALVYQAGLNLVFAMKGGDPAATAALEKVTESFQKGRGIQRAIGNLEKTLIEREDAIRAYLQRITES